uniref:Cna B-type domain-containing protein n=1 Tax=Slackia heliotrinireducens TaxID=84110 RepID=UPI00331627D7
MDVSKRTLNIVSILMSFLLVLNCFGATGIAFAEDGDVDAVGAAEEQTVAALADGEAESAEEPQVEASDPAVGEDSATEQEPSAQTEGFESVQAPLAQEATDTAAAEAVEPQPDQEVQPLAEPETEAEATRANAGDVRSQTSTDLENFLVNVTIDAPTDDNGAYIIKPNSTYEIEMRFAENEDLQFDDDAVLTYDFPAGMAVADAAATTFSIAVTDSTGTATVEGNTFEIVDGQLRVRFNQSDPNFDKLSATSNVKFDINVASTFEQVEGQLEFAPSIIKDFVFDTTADVTIDKSVVYDADSDTARYTLRIASTGTNENVVIEDRLTGTALVFNQDVSVVSSVAGALSVTPDYGSVPNGFRVEIPSMVDGEELTLTYTAAVDNTKITANGTVAQTNNTATVDTDQIPDPKSDSADFSGQVKFNRIDKEPAGKPVQIGEGLYEQTWTITVNGDHKMPMGGTYISDWIVQNSRPFMQFTGDGISVAVTMENGTTETRNVTWDDLRLYTSEYGTYGWGYLTPASDGKASYVITCKTIINTEGALGDLTLRNGAQVYSAYDEASVTMEGIGEGTFDIDKTAEGTTAEQTDWKITVTVPGSGLPDLRVVDDLPRLTYEGQEYVDTYIEDSITVEGLMDGESWSLYVGTNGKNYTLTIYQDEAQTQPGAKPSADGEPRDIVVRFKTAVNQDWLALATADGYESGTLRTHTNVANARSGSYRTDNAQASVVPLKPDFEKGFLERTESQVDGVTYPAFTYKLQLLGVYEDGAVIQDSFDTSYLKYYGDGGIVIRGSYTQGSSDADTNGSVTVAENAEGMAITVASFPKQANGNFYPYYEIEYTLMVKDEAALAALNEAAASAQGGVYLDNTATWNDLTSDESVNYTYFPYVDKELTQRPTSDNGYVAEFKVLINQYAEDLDPTSETLTILDELSSNLRFLPDSLTITPANDSIGVQYDNATNTISFTNVPDNTAFEVTYQARVLGAGDVSYSNTIKFGKYEKTIEESTTISHSGGGSASNPSITLVKRDAEDQTATLAGATFELYYMRGDVRVPVTDSNGNAVSFTTDGSGQVLIAGNQQSLGWTLWTDRTYCLVETAAPAGYEVNAEPVYFVLTDTPTSQMDFDIVGDTLNVNNERIKTQVAVTKEWKGPAVSSARVNLLANGEIVDSATLDDSNQWTYVFEGLDAYDRDGSEIAYSVEEEAGDGFSLISIEGNATEGFTVTNLNADTVNVPVQKEWVGPAAESVTMNLLADGNLVESAVLDEAGGWSHTFEGLPKYDASDGHEIVYTVEEDSLEGYSSVISGDAETGFVVTNTNDAVTEINGTKTWDDADNQDGVRPDSITVRLLADG